MDYFTICAQQTLLSDIFNGRKVDAVRLFDRHTVFVGFEGGPALKLSCVPGMPYLHTIEKRYIPKRNSRDWHLSNFSGNALERIEITPGDRVLTFHFDSNYRLIFEMTGRYANLIAVNPEGIVAGATRVITRRVSGYREIRPGVEYKPPPARDFFDLVWGALPVLEARLKSKEAEIVEALAVSLCAGSRLLAREAAARCGLNPGLTPVSLSQDDTLRLFKTIAAMVQLMEDGGEGGTVIAGDDGLPVDVFPVPMESACAGDKYYENINDAVIHYSRHRERGLELRQLRQSIRTTMSREEKRILSTIGKVECEIGGESESELLDHKGNIILSNLHHITRGMNSVTLPDLYGSGEVEIELDSSLDGPGNAERFFTRARKIRAASKHAGKRIVSLRKRIETLQTERERFESLEDLRELRKIAEEYPVRSAPGRAHDADRPFPRRFASVSGLEIIVGRNDRENDELVRRAHKNDIWLHAQGVGGSHVILRSPGKQNPDHQSLELAAAIAAYYSRAKTSAVVPVVWTRVKYVVKRRGQDPGQVHYTREKVLFVEPELPKDKNE